MKKTDSSIVVTGAAGQLGREICSRLASRAIPLTRQELNLEEISTIRSVLLPLCPEMIIHAAAYTQVDRAEEEREKAHRINAESVGVLTGVAKELNIPLLLVSTDYVFGEDESRQIPYQEEDPPAPVNIYGWTKRGGEQAAADWEKHWIVRTCGLYTKGENPTAKNFRNTIVRLCEKKPLRIVADQVCCPSFVPRVAERILKLAGLVGTSPSEWGIYHVVDEPRSWYQFACEILAEENLSAEITPIPTCDYPTPARRPLYSVLGNSKGV